MLRRLSKRTPHSSRTGMTVARQLAAGTNAHGPGTTSRRVLAGTRAAAHHGINHRSEERGHERSSVVPAAPVARRRDLLAAPAGSGAAGFGRFASAARP